MESKTAEPHKWSFPKASKKLLYLGKEKSKAEERKQMKLQIWKRKCGLPTPEKELRGIIRAGRY